MDDSQKIIKDQLDNLPGEARKFVLDILWVKTLKESVSQFKLEEDKIISLEYYVFNVLIGLTPYEDLTENIIRELGIDRNIAEWITESIEKDILEPYSELFPEENTVETKDVEKFSPNSYEQILINQAKAMRPVGIAPSNLPTEETSGVEERAIHHSIGYTNSDPYREPAE